MFKSLVFAVVLLTGSFVFAGEGRISRSFHVNSDLNTVSTWLNAHHDEVAESTHCQIVSRSGDLIRVRRSTMKGDFEFTLRESLTEGSGQGTYRLDFVESHRGRLADEKTVVTFSRSGNGTDVTIYAEAKVDDPRIRNAGVQAGLSASVRGFERMMLNRF